MKRPVSPHLQVYKLPLPAILSISHRISGASIFISMLLITWHVFFSFYFPNSAILSLSENLFNGYIGKGFFIALSAALYYHLCAGVSRLIWNTGRGFSRETVKIINYTVIISAIFLFIGTWSFIILNYNY